MKILILSFIFYLLSLVLTYTDKLFIFRWLSFGFWILAICLNIVSLIKPIKLKPFKNYFGRKNILFFSVLFLAIVFQFIFLNSYPFTAISDEIRDGGLNIQQILSGEIVNIFSWGRYNSHGLIIPTLASPFYYLFGNSVLTYRFPAAITGLTSVLLLYYLGKKYFNQTVAFFASILLLTIPFHLYYTRTEIVIAFSETFSILVLLTLFMVIKSLNFQKLIIFGLINGFALGFHASIRVLIFIGLLFLLHKILTSSVSFKKKVEFLITAIFAFFIGFGPRLIFTPPNILFHTERIPLLNKPELATTNTATIFTNIVDIGKQYLFSLNIFFFQRISSLPFDYKDTLMPTAFIIFIILGFWQLWRKNHFYFVMFLTIFLVLPFTNSAITDLFVYSHRLTPLWPMVALITAIGFDYFIHLVFKKAPSFYGKIIVISFFIAVIFRGFLFFYYETANKGKTSSDYLSMYTINNLKNLNSSLVCLTLSPSNYERYNLLHYQEQYAFFFPNKTINKSKKDNITDSEVIITGDCRIEKKNYNVHNYLYNKTKLTVSIENNLF